MAQSQIKNIASTLEYVANELRNISDCGDDKKSPWVFPDVWDKAEHSLPPEGTFVEGFFQSDIAAEQYFNAYVFRSGADFTERFSGERVTAPFIAWRYIEAPQLKRVPDSESLSAEVGKHAPEETLSKNNFLEIKVKYLRDILPIERMPKSDWIDLRIAIDVELHAGEYKLVPLGMAIELPKGYEAVVIPRSSTFKNYGIMLANSVGLIDCDYNGDNDEWHFPMFATRDTFIAKNTRIAQFRIQKTMDKDNIVLKTVDSLGNSDRNGIGSTGRV